MSKTASRLVLEPDAVQLLSEYGIPYPEHGLARGPDDAVRLGERLGYPVVLKVVSPDVVHKSDVGGVVVGVSDGDEVRGAYQRILDGVQTAVPKARIRGVLVCRQAREGLEVIVGALDDAAFGPTVMFGLGGIFAEALRDVSFRVAPLERRDAEEMVEEIRGYPLLTGTDGQSSSDLSAVTDLLMAVSQMVTDHQEIAELDLNPVRLFEQGLMVLDVRLLEKVAQ